MNVAYWTTIREHLTLEALVICLLFVTTLTLDAGLYVTWKYCNLISNTYISKPRLHAAWQKSMEVSTILSLLIKSNLCTGQT